MTDRLDWDHDRAAAWSLTPLAPVKALQRQSNVVDVEAKLVSFIRCAHHLQDRDAGQSESAVRPWSALWRRAAVSLFVSSIQRSALMEINELTTLRTPYSVHRGKNWAHTAAPDGDTATCHIAPPRCPSGSAGQARCLPACSWGVQLQPLGCPQRPGHHCSAHRGRAGRRIRKRCPPPIVVAPPQIALPRPSLPLQGAPRSSTPFACCARRLLTCGQTAPGRTAGRTRWQWSTA